MTTKIVLTVTGIDLCDFDTLETLGLHFSDLGWDSLGTDVTATVRTDSADPAAEVLDMAYRLELALPGIAVTGLDEELVGLSDIARRLSVSTEAVRLWASGKRRAASAAPFPRPRGRLTQGSTLVAAWAWADIVGWSRLTYCLDPEPGVDYLSPHATLSLAASLAEPKRPVRATKGSGRDWTPVRAGGFERTLNRIDDMLATSEGGTGRTRYVNRTPA